MLSRRVWRRICPSLALVAALGLAWPAPPGAASSAALSFQGWHLPVPAGSWIISRGPCGSSALYSHGCGYYEDRCAIDLTPVDASMLDVPVLAPQSGQVFFMGTRNASGLMLMLQHDDGRVSAMLHLSKIVVGLDQRVAQGQVVAYAGSSGMTSGPHLHFHVLPNAVERQCLPLDGLDQLDYLRETATSRNLAWDDLALVDPPPGLPDWLPLAGPDTEGASVRITAGLVAAPGQPVDVPVAVSDSLAPGGLELAGQPLSATLRLGAYTVFRVRFTAPTAPGVYQQLLYFRSAAPGAVGRALRLRYSVAAPPDSSAAAGIILISPAFVGPANYSDWSSPPNLCWAEPPAAGPAPLSFRVMVVGPQLADSGWQAAACWQAPSLAAGTYYWKVFVRDARGYMNRPNQRPYAFTLR